MIHEEVTGCSEVRGQTTNMLIDVMSMLPEVVQDYPILVIAHSYGYARDLANRFLGLCKGHEFPNLDIPPIGTQRWFWGVNVQKEPVGHCVYVPIMSGMVFDDSAKVIFSTWSNILAGRRFREIFIDHYAQEKESYRNFVRDTSSSCKILRRFE